MTTKESRNQNQQEISEQSPSTQSSRSIESKNETKTLRGSNKRDEAVRTKRKDLKQKSSNKPLKSSPTQKRETFADFFPSEKSQDELLEEVFKEKKLSWTKGNSDQKLKESSFDDQFEQSRYKLRP